MDIVAFPKFQNVGAMDKELCKAIKSGHSKFRLRLVDGYEDDFIVHSMRGDDIILREDDEHEFDCILDEDVESFIALD